MEQKAQIVIHRINQALESARLLSAGHAVLFTPIERLEDAKFELEAIIERLKKDAVEIEQHDQIEIDRMIGDEK